MVSGKQAGADGRAMVAAAYMGVLVGISLGPVYLLSGLGHAVEDHARTVRVAAQAEAARAEEARQDRLAALAPLAPPPAVIAASTGPAVRPAKPTRARELDCLAQAVYFEARGETPRGQAAVATVIMNRVKNPKFPKTVCGVVYQGASHHNGCQFSFACDGVATRVVEWDAWEEARKVAARALSGVVLRDIGSATHYHTIDAQPGWGARMLKVAQVGLHVFYRFNPHAPPIAADAEADDDTVLPSLPTLPTIQPRLEAVVSAPAVAAASAAAPAAATAPTAAAPAPVKLPEAAGAIAKAADTAPPIAKARDAT